MPGWSGDHLTTGRTGPPLPLTAASLSARPSPLQLLCYFCVFSGRHSLPEGLPCGGCGELHTYQSCMLTYHCTRLGSTLLSPLWNYLINSKAATGIVCRGGTGGRMEGDRDWREGLGRTWLEVGEEATENKRKAWCVCGWLWHGCALLCAMYMPACCVCMPGVPPSLACLAAWHAVPCHVVTAACLQLPACSSNNNLAPSPPAPSFSQPTTTFLPSLAEQHRHKKADPSCAMPTFPAICCLNLLPAPCQCMCVCVTCSSLCT